MKDKEMNNYTIVIARYNEMLYWVNKLTTENIVIYNKGGKIDKNKLRKCSIIKRPNIGREGETFLHHIIKNYNNLPKNLVFLQGYPFDHLHNINENNLNNSIKKLIKEKKHVIFLNKPFKEKVKVKRSYYFNEYYRLLFKSTLPTLPGKHYTFCPGGQYIISKDTILSKPKIFYSKINEMLKNSKLTYSEVIKNNFKFSNKCINGWTLERLFPYIFDIDSKINPKFIS